MKSTWPPPPSFSCPTSHGFSSDTDFRAWLPNFGTLLVQAEPQFPPRAFSLHECPFILCGDLTHQAGNSDFLPHSRPQWTPWVKMHRCMPQALQWPAQCVYGAKFQLPGTIPGLLTISRYSFTDFLLSTTASVFFFTSHRFFIPWNAVSVFSRGTQMETLPLICQIEGTPYFLAFYSTMSTP